MKIIKIEFLRVQAVKYLLNVNRKFKVQHSLSTAGWGVRDLNNTSYPVCSAINETEELMYEMAVTAYECLPFQ